MTPVVAVSSGVIAAIVIVFVVDLFAIMFGLSFVRERKARRAAEAGIEVGAGPRTPKPVSRRDFFRRSLLLSFGVFAAQFGGATIAFLWPNLKGGFGSVINAGKADDIKAAISDQGQPYYYGAGRFYIVPYSGSAEGDVDYAAEGVTENGLMPLYQRCVHLGCRVPFCAQSKWFECPCHGSKYNLAGEYKLGPAPRGLDRFKIQITDSGDVMVDTSVIVLGPPRGTDTIDEPPQGPFCVAPG
jgi:cytochrome b6-f complex iron-sulfur subunit